MKTTGKISNLVSDRGFGFISVEGIQKDVFFHMSSLHNVNFEELSVGSIVNIEILDGEKGPSARSVELLEQPARDSDNKEGYRFFNPYNFVRFLEPQNALKRLSESEMTTGTLLSQHEGLQELKTNFKKQDDGSEKLAMQLLGRCPPPPLDRAVGLSGSIKCSLTAVTPLFVSDSEGVTPAIKWIKERARHKSYRFYRHNERLAIPASSLRGMIRSVFDAATNSCMINFDGNRRLTRHIMPEEALRLVPGRVVQKDEESGLSLELYTGNNGKSFNPDNWPKHSQYAAWVPAYLERPRKQGRDYTKKNDYSNRRNLVENIATLDEVEYWGLLRLYTHPKKRFSFYSVEKLVPVEGADQASPFGKIDAGCIVGRGYLHVTNRNIGNKHDERFFFTTDDNWHPSKILELKKNVVKSYEGLIEDYQQKNRNEKDRKLSKKNEKRRDSRRENIDLSKHILDFDARKLRHGATVYALIKHDDTADDYVVTLLVPVALPRVFYEDSMKKRVPYCYEENDSNYKIPGNLAPCSDSKLLCPSCRVFGWVAQENGDIDPFSQVSYSGRVKFGMANLQGTAESMEPFAMSILSSPKPTTKHFYLAKNSEDDYTQSGLDQKWSEQSAALAWDDLNYIRGRKFYRHQDPQKQLKRSEYRRAEAKADDQNRTVIDALKPGCVFNFNVEYENISEIELGALLWSLEMTDLDAHHKLGYGKPLGFGSVRVKVNSIGRVDHQLRYSSINRNSGWSDVTKEKNQYISLFKDSLVSCYKHLDKTFETLPNISDLKSLLARDTAMLPVHYPRPSEEPAVDGKNFKWFVANKRGPGYTLQHPGADEGLPLLNKRR